ncbi:MAG TPA: major capsid protein [Rhodocyclaceae bacterium]|nr:major capsid protein [Rhodocyclaceae bacterium]
MKFMNQARAFGRKVAVNASAGFGGLALLAGKAMAAVPADVTTAMGEAKTDATTVATTVLGIVFALLAFAYMRRQAH